ncbi:MAG: alpha/beta hydrolase [Gammaproteobacteria bacterium]
MQPLPEYYYPKAFPTEPHCKVVWAGPAGALEGQTTWPKSGEPQGVAVICHPHPLQGGTMYNKVVTTLMRFYRDNDWATVRFNYRGVGESEGEYGATVGEQEDLSLLWRWARHTLPDLPVALAGFSFGSYIASALANGLGADEKAVLHHVISVAPPADRCNFDELHIPVPWYVVMGDKDEIVPFDAVEQWVNRHKDKIEFILMPEAGHFFHGQLTVMIQKLMAVVELRR